MSYLILCSGEQTKKPYHFELTDTNIYSIEELCYYLFNNIYVINTDFFDAKMVRWINDDIKMPELASKLNTMIENKNNLKDIVVTILCSADYYGEQEIRNLIETIDIIEGMPAVKRRKIKADNLLRYCNYSMAGREYESILASNDVREFDDVEYGNMLHNLAIVRVHTSSFASAASYFKEAYQKNKNTESLKQYFYTLKLDKQDDVFESEMINYSVNPQFVANIAAYFNEMEEEAHTSQRYVTIDRLYYLKNEGRVNEYYDAIDRLMLGWKRDYKSKRASLAASKIE